MLEILLMLYNSASNSFYDKSVLDYITTHAHTQPFNRSLVFVQENPGELVPEGTFCHLLD